MSSTNAVSWANPACGNSRAIPAAADWAAADAVEAELQAFTLLFIETCAARDAANEATQDAPDKRVRFLPTEDQEWSDTNPNHGNINGDQPEC